MSDIQILESYLWMLVIDYDLEIHKESYEKSMYVNPVYGAHNKLFNILHNKLPTYSFK